MTLVQNPESAALDPYSLNRDSQNCGVVFTAWYARVVEILWRGGRRQESVRLLRYSSPLQFSAYEFVQWVVALGDARVHGESLAASAGSMVPVVVTPVPTPRQMRLFANSSAIEVLSWLPCLSMYECKGASLAAAAPGVKVQLQTL